MRRLPGVAETERTLAEVIPAVARMYRKRCTRVGDCIVHSPVTVAVPQLRVRFVTMSAVRAVYWVSRGERPDPEMDVRRTCDNRLCVNPWHLFLEKRGPSSLPVYRERMVAANLAACFRVRSYTPKQERQLRRLVDRGLPIRWAADRAKMSRGAAYHVIAGRSGEGAGRMRRPGSRGRRGREMCTRCNTLGHRRTSPQCEGGR